MQKQSVVSKRLRITEEVERTFEKQTDGTKTKFAVENKNREVFESVGFDEVIGAPGRKMWSRIKSNQTKRS